MSNNIIINRSFSDILSSELFLDLDNKSIFEQLLLNGADVNYTNNSGWNLLFEAISLGLTDKIDKLLFLGININIRDDKGRNALFWAIYHRRFDVIRKLISLNINTRVTDCLSAINYAVYRNDVKVLKCLRNCGLDINEYDAAKSTPLIYAVLYNKFHTIDYLIKNGALIDHVDDLGNSALSLAYDLKIDFLINKFKTIIRK